MARYRCYKINEPVKPKRIKWPKPVEEEIEVIRVVRVCEPKVIFIECED